MKETAIPKYQAVHDEILNALMAGHYSIGTGSRPKTYCPKPLT